MAEHNSQSQHMHTHCAVAPHSAIFSNSLPICLILSCVERTSSIRQAQIHNHLSGRTPLSLWFRTSEHTVWRRQCAQMCLRRQTVSTRQCIGFVTAPLRRSEGAATAQHSVYGIRVRTQRAARDSALRSGWRCQIDHENWPTFLAAKKWWNRGRNVQTSFTTSLQP